MTATTGSRYRNWILLAVAAIVLLPSLLGFALKIFELVTLYEGHADGAFAVAPLLNYLLATTGFVLLFAWATLNGMFSDIESPKHSLLETEELLDRAEAEERRQQAQRRAVIRPPQARP